MAEDEISPGGSRIYRHQARKGYDDLSLSRGDPDLIDAVEAHLARCFGESPRMVLHEILSTDIHLDVHQVAPSEEFPFWRLVTSGMAELPMSVPEGFPDTPFAELTIALPAEWPLDREDFEDESVYWPIRLLKGLARLPHEYSTFLWHGHTIPNGDPPAPYARDVGVCCALIIPPLEVPDGFDRFELPNGATVEILGVLPIYEAEMKLKLRKGADAFYERLVESGRASDVIDPRRPDVA